jgi:peptidoglycan-associated lipoprotein
MAGQAAQDFQNQDINFDFDKYDLRTDARSILDRKMAFLNQNSSVRAQIEGHCDERGTNAYNMALGERRANAAKQYLSTGGINPARLSTISYGEERPLDPGHNEAAWAKNRRAHFVITAQ